MTIYDTHDPTLSKSTLANNVKQNMIKLATETQVDDGDDNDAHIINATEEAITNHQTPKKNRWVILTIEEEANMIGM